MFRFINQKKIMTYETILLLAITLTTATVAWFIIQNNASTSGLDIQAASSKYIKVALTQNGEDVSDLLGDSKYVSLNLVKLSNVKEGELAPGTYGQTDIYITSQNAEANAYRITPQIECVFVDAINSADEEMKDNVMKAVRKLVSGHLSLCTQRNAEGVETKYITPISGQDYAGNIVLNNCEGSLDEVGTEVKTTLYWRWIYEYFEVPECKRPEYLLAESETDYRLEPLQLFDYSKYDPTDTSFVKYSREDLYDYADSIIAAYVKSIDMRLKVEGYHK